MSYLFYSTKIARYLVRNTNVSNEKEEVLAYAIEVISFNFLNIGMSLLIGYILGVVPGTMVCLLTVFAIRIFAGGAHSESAWRCAAITALIYPIMGLLASKTASMFTLLKTDIFITFSFLIGFLALFFLAPVDTPNAPIISSTRRNRLKLMSLVSLVIIGTAALIIRFNQLVSTELLYCIAFGVIWSSLVLTPIGHKLFIAFDRLKIKKERRYKSNESNVL